MVTKWLLFTVVLSWAFAVAHLAVGNYALAWGFFFLGALNGFVVWRRQHAPR